MSLRQRPEAVAAWTHADSTHAAWTDAARVDTAAIMGQKRRHQQHLRPVPMQPGLMQPVQPQEGETTKESSALLRRGSVKKRRAHCSGESGSDMCHAGWTGAGRAAAIMG